MTPKDPSRNEPAEKGSNNDPNVRDYTAIQPGVNTISQSDFDEENKKLTETAKDNFRESSDNDEKADRSFDEIDGDK